MSEPVAVAVGESQIDPRKEVTLPRQRQGRDDYDSAVVAGNRDLRATFNLCGLQPARTHVEKASRVMAAMLEMKKIDIATLKQAYAGSPSTACS